MILSASRQKVYQVCGFVFGLMMILGAQPALANIDQIKVYKEAFPGSKPQCIFCHKDKMPKKDAGAHDLSAYGTKVKEAAEQVTADSYKQVGAHENFIEGSEAAVPEAQQ